MVLVTDLADNHIEREPDTQGSGYWVLAARSGEIRDWGNFDAGSTRGASHVEAVQEGDSIFGLRLLDDNNQQVGYIDLNQRITQLDDETFTVNWRP